MLVKGTDFVIKWKSLRDLMSSMVTVLNNTGLYT